MHPLLLRVLQYNDLSIAGDLFSVSDADIVKDLPEVWLSAYVGDHLVSFSYGYVYRVLHVNC